MLHTKKATYLTTVLLQQAFNKEEPSFMFLQYFLSIAHTSCDFSREALHETVASVASPLPQLIYLYSRTLFSRDRSVMRTFHWLRVAVPCSL